MSPILGLPLSVIKNCNVLTQAAINSKSISATQRSGYWVLPARSRPASSCCCSNLTDSNGVRINVADPDHLGPLVSPADALAAISALLDSAKTDLGSATVPFTLAGFGGFGDAAGLLKVNRALAARVDVYRQNWATALTDLQASFFLPEWQSLAGRLSCIRYRQRRPVEFLLHPQNQTGEVRVAHPSYATDIAQATIASVRLPFARPRFPQRAFQQPDVWVYTTSTTSIPIVRNEELVLIYAEANIQNNDLPDGVIALNVIRHAHGLSPYAAALTKPH